MNDEQIGQLNHINLIEVFFPNLRGISAVEQTIKRKKVSFPEVVPSEYCCQAQYVNVLLGGLLDGSYQSQGHIGLA